MLSFAVRRCAVVPALRLSVVVCILVYCIQLWIHRIPILAHPLTRMLRSILTPDQLKSFCQWLVVSLLLPLLLPFVVRRDASHPLFCATLGGHQYYILSLLFSAHPLLSAPLSPFYCSFILFVSVQILEAALFGFGDTLPFYYSTALMRCSMAHVGWALAYVGCRTQIFVLKIASHLIYLPLPRCFCSTAHVGACSMFLGWGGGRRCGVLSQW
jgi:hypothetical protein